MPKFVYIYHAPPMSPEAMPTDPDQAKAVMDAWYAWGEKVGEGLLDFGTPLAEGVRVTPGGTADSTLEVAGYSIIEAADMDAAVALAQDHPHLQMPGGCVIEVHAAQPVPGQEE